MTNGTTGRKEFGIELQGESRRWLSDLEVLTQFIPLKV